MYAIAGVIVVHSLTLLMDRVTSCIVQVGKQLLLLYVNQQTAVAWTSPACLSSFTVSTAMHIFVHMIAISMIALRQFPMERRR